MTLRSIDGGRANQPGVSKDAGTAKDALLGQDAEKVRGIGQAGGQAAGGQANLQAGARPDPRAPQMPWLAIYLTVKDMEASLEFYGRAFGFEAGTVLRDEQGALLHAELQYKGEIPVMLAPETGPECTTPSPATLGVTMPVFFYFYHDDVDALYAQAKGAGAQVEMEPEDMFWGDRMAGFLCPNGYRWNFATHTGQSDGPSPGAAA